MFSDLSDQVSTVAERLTLPAGGRRTSSPPQLGQMEFIDVAQSRQNVHSWTQMKASPSAASDRPHFSHSFFISSAIGSDDCRQILRNWNAQNEFNHHAGAEEVDLRNSGQSGAVAEDLA